MGVGMGLFSCPNTASIMNSLPPRLRGAGSGMRATLMSSGTLVSLGLFFTLVIAGFSARLPGALYAGLTRSGVPPQAAAEVSHLSPTAALFAALLGYNPMAHLLPAPVLQHLPAAARATVVGREFFPDLISPAFGAGLHDAFWFGALLCLAAAVASVLRGRRYIYGVSSGADRASEVTPEPGLSLEERSA